MDHVAVWTDANGNVNVTLQLDSKQLNSKGVTLDPKAAGGNMQLSTKWDEIVLKNLPDNSVAKRAILSAQENGTLVKGVAYVDKDAGTLNITRINPGAASMNRGTTNAPQVPTIKP